MSQNVTLSAIISAALALAVEALAGEEEEALAGEEEDMYRVIGWPSLMWNVALSEKESIS
jgi:hypothetical protein